MKNILTITFNPCIDKSTSVTSLIAEKKLNCSRPTFDPGGGGINVARAIKKLGGEATAIYPAGGYSGKFLKVLLDKENVESLVVDTAQHTRENMIVLDLSSNQQYRFGMPGQELLEEEWTECLQLVEETDSEFIVASGSLPPGVPKDIFARIAKIANKSKRKLIVDTSADALAEVLRESLYLIKPNLGELAVLEGKQHLTIHEVEEAARKVIDQGRCKIVVVSMGSAGAMMATEKEIYQVKAPSVKSITTVGAGDSMVAGIVYSLSTGKTFREAINYGVACGTAATLTPGTQLCKPDDVKKIYEEMIALTPALNIR